MASDYQGDPKDFALVIPVPTVVRQEDIHVLDQALLDRLDKYSEPRLVEYDDGDPCAPMGLEEVVVTARRMEAPSERAKGVTVEARYSVEEYEIVILSAEQSDGLQSWLTENGYDPAYGARPLRRLVQTAIGDPLARMLIAGQVLDGQHVRVDREGDGLQLSVVDEPVAA